MHFSPKEENLLFSEMPVTDLRQTWLAHEKESPRDPTNFVKQEDVRYFVLERNLPLKRGSGSSGWIIVILTGANVNGNFYRLAIARLT